MANQQLREQVEDYKASMRKSSRVKKISFAVALCCAVIAIVALVLPAATLEFAAPQCGQEEHTHTEACYGRTLACELPEGTAHVHTASCYNDAGTLACGQTAAGHMHLASCVDAQGKLVCGEEETVHQHSAACVDAATNTLVCDTAELDHVHGDTCYALTDAGYQLVCQQEAVNGHVHSAVCQDETGVVACGLEEFIQVTHKHDDGCYVTDEAACGMEEHTHSDLCYDEISLGIMKDQAAKESDDDAALSDSEESVDEGEAEESITAEEIAEAKDNGFYFENDYMIITFQVPDKIADRTVIEVTEVEATESEEYTEESAEAISGESEEADSEDAYVANLDVEAYIDGVPVENLSDLEATFKVQMKDELVNDILGQFEDVEVDEEIKGEIGAEMTVEQELDESQVYSISEYADSDKVETIITDADKASSPEITLFSNSLKVVTEGSANPTFTVQYYALIDQFVTEPQEATDRVIDSIIDTSADEENNSARLPKNGYGYNDAPNTGLKNMVLKKNGDKYEVRTEKVLHEMYTSDSGNNYVEKPNLNYFNKLQENGNYKISEVWVLKEGVDTEVANKVSYSDIEECNRYWDIYKNDDASYRFTNRIESAGDNYIFIEDGAVIRLVNRCTNENLSNVVNFYDYDISNGNSTSSNGVQTMYTNKQGINSDSNYGDGAHLAFGNVNTGTGLGTENWNGNALNGANGNKNGAINGSTSVTYKGCTFGLVTGMENGVIQYADGVAAPNLFNETEGAVGKTSIPGSLSFSRVGDSYTLSSASIDGASTVTATDLDEFVNPVCDGKVYDQILTNNFWPMDDAETFGASGHDIAFGDITLKDKRKYSGADNKTAALPPSDDGKDHNSYFGMKYEIDFELSSDYKGPLNYLFFGDDDLWIFLSEVSGEGDNATTSNSQLVVDIGGVHSSVGEYVDLWDYLTQGDEGKYRLTVFYTERGASGSTCFMNYTLPSVSFPGSTRTTGSLEISKEVANGKADSADEEFEFTINFYDNNGTPDDLSDDIPLPDDYAYVKYDDNNSNFKYNELLVHDGATFSLKDGQRIVVSNLPINTRFEITEADDDGKYITSSTFIGSSLVAMKGDKSITGNITDASQVSVSYKNTRAYELPSTGGEGTQTFYLLGSMLVLFALVAMWYRRTSAHTAAVNAAGMQAISHDATIYGSPSGMPESSYKKEKGSHRNWGVDASTRKGGR